MGPFTKAKSKLSAMIDSDEDEMHFVERDARPTPDSAQENTPAKKGRGRPKGATNKVTKSKAPARKTAAAATVSKALGKRAPLSDKTNERPARATEEQEDSEMVDAISEDELDASVVVEKAKPVKKAKKAVATKSHQESEDELEEKPATKSRSAVTKQKTNKAKREPSLEVEPSELVDESMNYVQETQVSEIEVEEEPEEIDEPTPQPPPKAANRIRSESRQRPSSLQRKRAGSASDTERNDPAIRRKLGDVNKKLENMEFKYRNLREIGIKEAEHNFERLKAQSEAKTKGRVNLLHYRA
jgi:hypothetical protein